MRKLLALAAAVALAACGEEDPQPAAKGPEPTAEAPTPTPEPTPAPARSARACTELWNAEARRGSAGQKAPPDYLAEVAAEGDPRVLVTFENGECLVFARLPRNRAYVFVAPGGLGRYGHPSQVRLPTGRSLRHNGRATADGRIEPG